MWLFPALATVVSAAFSWRLAGRWMQNRRPYLLAWTVALAMFALATAATAWGLAAGWTSSSYRAYYVFGAVVNVPFLALGTIFLLGPRRLGYACAIVVALAAGFAVVRVATVDVDSSALVGHEIPSGRDAMPDEVRSLSRYYSFAGFFVVVGGALWSAARLARKREESAQRLARANLLIAFGTFVVALGSGFARYGEGAVFSVALALGVSLMFAGFLLTQPRAVA